MKTKIILIYTYTRDNSLLPENLFNFIDMAKESAKRRYKNHEIKKVNVLVNLKGEFVDIQIIMERC